MTDQTMTPEQALTRAQTLVGKLRGKHVAGSLSLDEQMELGLCWQTLRAALSRPAVPEGWKLVPVEPTQEMLDATSCPGCAKTDYRHMLAAAPEPAEGFLTGEQSEEGLVAGYAAVYEGRICHEFFNATPEGLKEDTAAAGFDAPEAIVALYPKSVKDERDALRERVKELETDAAMLDQMQDECWNVECEEYPIADSGDSDIEWRVFSSHMAEPRRREIGYGRTPREALNAAMQEGE